MRNKYSGSLIDRIKDKFYEGKNNPAKRKKFWTITGIAAGCVACALVILAVGIHDTATDARGASASGLINEQGYNDAGGLIADIDWDTIIGYDADGNPIYGTKGLVAGVGGYDMFGAPIASSDLVQTGTDVDGNPIYGGYSAVKEARIRGIKKNFNKDIDWDHIVAYDEDGNPIYGSLSGDTTIIGYDAAGNPIPAGTYSITGKTETGLPIYGYSTREKQKEIGVAAANGKNGSNGSAGVNGANGKDGSGLNGTDGNSGSDGKNGANGVGVTGANGKNGIGVTGAAGTNGKDGTGTAGVNGKDGTGTAGVNGKDGKGTAGTNGSNGTNGVSVNGTNGTNGASGSTGSSGKAGINGVNGSSGSNGANGVNGKSADTAAVKAQIDAFKSQIMAMKTALANANSKNSELNSKIQSQQALLDRYLDRISTTEDSLNKSNENTSDALDKASQNLEAARKALADELHISVDVLNKLLKQYQDGQNAENESMKSLIAENATKAKADTDAAYKKSSEDIAAEKEARKQALSDQQAAQNEKNGKLTTDITNNTTNITNNTTNITNNSKRINGLTDHAVKGIYDEDNHTITFSPYTEPTTSTEGN